MSDVLEFVYAASLSPNVWPGALEKIGSYFADPGAIIIYGKSDNSFGVIASDALHDMATEYNSRWSNSDIRAMRAQERGFFISKEVITDRDVVSEAEMSSDPHYALFLKRHGLKYFAAASVTPDPAWNVAISVQRREDRQPYSENELKDLLQISRHVEQSLRIGVKILESEYSKRSLATILSEMDVGVMIVDYNDRVIFSNAIADGYVGDGLDLVDGSIILSGAADKAWIRSAFDAVAGDIRASLSRPLMIKRRGAATPLVMRVLPMRLGPNSPPKFLASAKAIVLLSTPNRPGSLDVAVLKDMLGLTLGEAKLAAVMSKGVGPRDAARELGISENTARSVLKTIFAKTGVSRQSALVRLLSTMGS